MVIGTYDIPSGNGGIVGRILLNASNDPFTLTVTGCYTTGRITGTGSGGIVGYVDSGNGNPSTIITHCFSTGEITGWGAGIIASAQNATVQHCYSSGNVTGSNGAGIANSTSPSTTITNCYHSGTAVSGGASILTTANGLTVTNCYSLNATAVSTAGNFHNYEFSNPTFTNCGVGSGSWGTPIVSGYLDNTSSVWDTSSTPFRLAHFLSPPWDDSTYSTADDDNIGFTGGDPHIIPFIGSKYHLDILGPFKHFDNNHKNRLVINGYSDFGDHKHYKLTYVRKLFIWFMGKSVLIDMGFRAKKVKILENNGFSDFTIKDLPMGQNIKRLCQLRKCRCTTKDNNDTSHNETEPPTEKSHYFHPLIRNEIKMQINVPDDNNYTITMRNVNYMNTHPCEITIVPKDLSKIKNYSGALIRECNVNDVKIDNIKTIETINNKLNMQFLHIK
jgi:hypothetical protein